jgi:hypothetical protein
MFGRKKRAPAVVEVDSGIGTVDGGEGRGVPLGGQDSRPPTGYLQDPDDDFEDRDFLWEEGDPADRRKDPLRKP